MNAGSQNNSRSKEKFMKYSGLTIAAFLMILPTVVFAEKQPSNCNLNVEINNITDRFSSEIAMSLVEEVLSKKGYTFDQNARESRKLIVSLSSMQDDQNSLHNDFTAWADLDGISAIHVDSIYPRSVLVSKRKVIRDVLNQLPECKSTNESVILPVGEITCSKVKLGITYGVELSIPEGSGPGHISITTSTDDELPSGRRGVGPVLYQEFSKKEFDQGVTELSGSVASYGEFVEQGQAWLDLVKLTESANGSLQVLLKGRGLPVLSLWRIHFKGCSKTVKN